MTNTQYPSDQSTEAVLVSANEFLAAARAGAITPPDEEPQRELSMEPDWEAMWEDRLPEYWD